MKICFLTNSIFSLGGVQRVHTTIANYLIENYEVDIICTNKEKENRELYNLDSRINYIHLPFEKSLISSLIKKINTKTGMLNIGIFNQLLKRIYFNSNNQNLYIDFLNKKEYDIIIASESYLTLFLATIADKISCKTIGWQHSSFQSYFKSKGRHFYNVSSLANQELPKLDAYVVLTKSDSEDLRNYLGIKSFVIHNPLGFSSDKLTHLNNKRIIALGRLVEMKGFDMLIKSFNNIHSKHDTWKVDIFGEGPYKKKLNSLIKKYNLEKKISIKGKTHNVKDELIKSDILVLTSKWEGFGMVILEAMECGVPVIAFNTTGSTEIINEEGKNGVIVENGNIDELSRNIDLLISDTSLLTLLSVNGKKRAADFSLDKIIKKWTSLFESL